MRQKIFQNRLVKGVAIGAQPTLADDLNTVQDILENVEALPPLRLDKNGIDWRLSVDGSIGSQKAVSKVINEPSGIPAGYTEATVTLVTKTGMYTATILVKNGSLSAFSSSQNKKLLQINSAGEVAIDSGYLV